LAVAQSRPIEASQEACSAKVIQSVNIDAEGAKTVLLKQEMNKLGEPSEMTSGSGAINKLTVNNEQIIAIKAPFHPYDDYDSEFEQDVKDPLLKSDDGDAKYRSEFEDEFYPDEDEKKNDPVVQTHHEYENEFEDDEHL
jgi:hypothetical protein